MQSRRQCTICFTVPDGQGHLKKVCKNTFKQISDISPQKITTLVRRKKAGFSTYKDKRVGVRKFKYTLHDRNMVKEHINNFPKEQSHYTRAR